MDSARLEAILGSPLLWGFIGLVALAVSLSGRLDMTAAKWVLVVAWVMAIVSIYRFDLILHLPIIPRILWVAMLSAAIGLVLYYVSMWMSVKAADVSQQLTDLVEEVKKLRTDIAKSPSVDPSVQLSILKDEQDRLSKRREELTTQEKETLDKQALTLKSLEEGRQQHAAAAEVEKQQQELAARERQIQRQKAAQLEDEEERKFAIRYAPVLNYVVATLHETLSNIARESSELISTDFSGDRPSIYNSTFLKDGKFQKGKHLISIGSHKEWEFHIRPGGSDTISRRSLNFQIAAGPIAHMAVPWYSIMTVSSDGNPAALGPVKLNVECVADKGGPRTRKKLYSESFLESEYQKPIREAINALIQDRYNALPLGRGASPTPPSSTPDKGASTQTKEETSTPVSKREEWSVYKAPAEARIPSTHTNTFTTREVERQIGSAGPLQRDDVAKEFVNGAVDWTLVFGAVRPLKEDASLLEVTFSTERTGGGPKVTVQVPRSGNEYLGLIKGGDEVMFNVKGTISEIDVEKHSDMKLVNASFKRLSSRSEHLTPAQRGQFVSMLRHARGQRVGVFSMSTTDETLEFTNQVTAGLRDAGIIVSAEGPGTHPSGSDVWIVAPWLPTKHPFVENLPDMLVVAFEKIGIFPLKFRDDASQMSSPEDVTIFIFEKA